MAKQLSFDSAARESLRRGVDQVANAVRVTLGPRGRSVVLDRRSGAPTITNDGMTIAREIDLADPYENLGAQLIKEVSAKTQEVAGDGTTTAMVLAQAIVREGLRVITGGANPMVRGRSSWTWAIQQRRQPRPSEKTPPAHATRQYVNRRLADGRARCDVERLRWEGELDTVRFELLVDR